MLCFVRSCLVALSLTPPLYLLLHHPIGIMDADQFAQFMGRLGQQGGTKKLNTLELVNGSECRTFRDHFQTVCQSDHWNNRQCRRKLKAAMTGDASRLTQDIDVKGIDDDNTVVMCLTAYQDRFQSAAAGQVARVEFHAAA